MLEIIIIFIVVIAAFAGVVWYAMRSTRQQKQNSLSEQAARVEPELDKENAFSAVLEQEMTQHIIDTGIDSEPNVSLSQQAKQEVATPAESAAQQGEIHFKANDEIDTDIEIAAEPEPAISIVNDWDMVIAFTIMAEQEHTFSGEDIKLVLESEQFHYGEMQLFHQLTKQKTPMFSAANVVARGKFDMQNISSMTTPGILVFAKLPSPINGLTLFDHLLETSRKLTEKLNGILCDESRQAVTEEMIEAMRSRVLSHNFSMHSTSQDAHVYTE
ncbi:MAG: cell division protein ZipA C-terminal FtsZ-binding domain-containing protein [Methylophaga sp.]|nr:cell division protein ZipA C-terminal FtsZ-binding domain-containing protein [Methylophaga sp.]